MAELQIETYEIEECEFAGDNIDTDKYKEYFDKLGLKGQTKILTGPGDTGIPFQKMSSGVYNVWKTYCPGKYKLEDYQETLIPIRVLGLLSICKERNYFSNYQIWTENRNNPDPILVASAEDNYSMIYSSDAYLIARWGESLKSWPEIVKGAKDKLRPLLETELKKYINIAQSNIGVIDGFIDRYLDGETSVEVVKRIMINGSDF